ncbi:MAG TPA: hypothetical protein VMA95_04355 [Streptosporangiaceae bacterium]|nr:hypothetical protein [Streptosporangiaceae bacterium]
MTNLNVVYINASYLTNTLEPALKEILSEVDAQLKGLGPSSNPNITEWLYPVDDNLSVEAGGTAGSSGGGSFDIATDLNTSLKNMGGSVNDQLVWLQKVLNDMINEINTTVASFSGTESLNGEAVQQLLTDFQNTISDVDSPPGSSSSSSSTS